MSQFLIVPIKIEQKEFNTVVRLDLNKLYRQDRGTWHQRFPATFLVTGACVKNLSLNMKFVFVLSIFIVASVTISVVGLNKMSVINAMLDNIAGPVARRMVLAMEIEEIQTNIALQERTLIFEPAAEGQKRYIDILDGLNKQLMERGEELLTLVRPENKPLVEKYKHDYHAFWAAHLKVRELALHGKSQEAHEYARGEGRKLRYEAAEGIERIVKANIELLNAEQKESDVIYFAARDLIITLSVGSILFGCVLAFFVLRALSKSIDTVISNLDENSNQVTSAAQQIAAVSEQLSQATTEQAASLEQTAASIEEMNSMIQKTSDNATKSAKVSNDSQNTAERGKTAVQEMITAIGDIGESNTNIMNQVDESNRQIADIVKVIAEIGEKTKVINDIVFQTKLLSFNASVEAARAGEHGKGFAVVAEEVGNLAQMSGNAAKEISGLLEGSIHKVESIVQETQSKVGSLISQGKEKIESGTSVAERCGQVLEEIVGNVGSVANMVNDISGACSEQAQGGQEIAKAMAQLDQVTQENAASSQEAASSAEQLSAQADALKQVVNTLITVIKGGNQSAAHHSELPGAVKAKAPVRAKVLNFKKPEVKANPAPVKVAVGQSSGSTPSQDDPRFTDV